MLENSFTLTEDYFPEHYPPLEERRKIEKTEKKGKREKGKKRLHKKKFLMPSAPRLVAFYDGSAIP